MNPEEPKKPRRQKKVVATGDPGKKPDGVAARPAEPEHPQGQAVDAGKLEHVENPFKIKKKVPKPHDVDPITESPYFISVMKGYSPGFLSDVQLKICDRWRPEKILKWLGNSYPKSVVLPGLDVLKPWIKHVKAQIRAKKREEVSTAKEVEEGQRTLIELKQMNDRMKLADADIFNRKGTLETMVQFMLVRVEGATKRQSFGLDARLEQVITNQIGEIHKMLQSLMSYETKLGLQEYAARLIVQKAFRELGPIARDAAQRVYGEDKAKDFLEEFKLGLKGVDFQRIRREAINEALETEKKGESIKDEFTS